MKNVRVKKGGLANRQANRGEGLYQHHLGEGLLRQKTLVEGRKPWGEKWNDVLFASIAQIVARPGENLEVGRVRRRERERERDSVAEFGGRGNTLASSCVFSSSGRAKGRKGEKKKDQKDVSA